ncbi:hypothetical protein EZV62_028091 [Acer yangbiense]|uniref:Ubiquitin-like domain-containing protein n=1 Tax=Acer yangbiense TaxID=1000413 RepID=A0A5C7GPI6_9ROSI|nr:hypothetical protein EZV62_028091 [Acer yangbiense]
MKVKKSETIENLRVMLREKEGISEGLQKLSYNGQRLLHDSRRIMDEDIAMNSTIYLQEQSQKKLLFKMPSNEKSFELEVMTCYSFHRIKGIIRSKVGIHPNEYTLYYGKPVLISWFVASLGIKANWPSEDWDLFSGSTRLWNARTLAYYEIKENDMLKMLPAMYQISVRTQTGKIVTLEVRQSDTIRSVKEKYFQINVYLKVMKTVALKVNKSETVRNLKALFCEKEGTSEGVKDLFFAGEQLQDDERLVDHAIQTDTSLYVVLENGVGTKLYVKIPKNQKTITVIAMAHHTVRDIRSMIQAKEVGSMIGMSVSDQIMIYGGEQLEDCKILAFYDVKEESMLEICPPSIQIFVKTASEDIVKVKVKVLFTVGDVKAIVGGEIGYSVSFQNLFYAGKKLEDSKTIACYDIKDQSFLQLESPQTQIFVKTWDGKTVTLDVELSNTIKDVKDKLFAKLQIPFKFQKFVFDGKQLEEDRDLASYNIQKHCTLGMVFSSTAKIIRESTLPLLVPENRIGIRLSVRIRLEQKTIAVEAMADQTIEDIKAIVGRMIDMSDVSQQIMTYAGEQLEDCKTLDCYNIKDESMLELLPPDDQIQIFVKTWSGKTITLDVQLISTIKDIKYKLFDKLRIPFHLQSVVFAGKRLEENRDLASYNVQQHSTLHMVFCPSSKIIRLALSNFGSDLSLSTTISELKDIAKLKWKNPVKEVVLSGAALQDQYSLRDYGLGRESELDFVF